MTPISVAVSSQEHSLLLFLPILSFFPFFFLFLSDTVSDLMEVPEDVPDPDWQLHSFEPDFSPDSLEADPDPDSPLSFFFFLLSSGSSSCSSVNDMRAFGEAERDLVDLADTRSVIRIIPQADRRRAIFIIGVVYSKITNANNAWIFRQSFKPHRSAKHVILSIIVRVN